MSDILLSIDIHSSSSLSFCWCIENNCPSPFIYIIHITRADATDLDSYQVWEEMERATCFIFSTVEKEWGNLHAEFIVSESWNLDNSL